MAIAKKISAFLLIGAMALTMCLGYATLTESLGVSGAADVSPTMPDVYITKVTPGASAGVTVTSTYGTVFFAEVDASGTAEETAERIIADFLK